MSREYALYWTELFRNQHSSINIFIAFDGIIVKIFNYFIFCRISTCQRK